MRRPCGARRFCKVPSEAVPAVLLAAAGRDVFVRRDAAFAPPVGVPAKTPAGGPLPRPAPAVFLSEPPFLSPTC